MSALLGFAGAEADGMHEAQIRDLLAAMSHRGAEEMAVWRAPGVVLAVARDRWETGQGFAGPTRVAARGPIHVISDASLYYVADLRVRLAGAGVLAESDSPADLIAAAYAAFGPDCVGHLEGDFAFCLWDERDHTLLCGRDPFGTRSLFYSPNGEGFLAASTPHPLVRRQGAGAGFDATDVLRSLLMRYGDGSTTAWKGVRELPAGHSLRVSGQGVDTTRYWGARGADRWRALTSDDAVEAFTSLLREAARERAHPGEWALAMSGGLDSTGIMASLEPRSGRMLSFRLADGDPGNEGWYVERVADSFGVSVHWVETSEIGLFADAIPHARRRSQCHGYIFEGHNRALASAARGLGGRILLNGHGGDNVCGVGDWEMADLLRAGRLLRLRKFVTDRGYRGVRSFLHHALRPAVPFWALDALEPALGRHICSRPYERPVPPWVTVQKSRLAVLTREDRRDFWERIARPRASVVDRWRAWLLEDPGFSRSCAMLYDLSREAGVELRMPFYDGRLVEFALSRPAGEFNLPRQNKVLLRRALEGKLPDRTRDPQPGGLKPGTAIGVVSASWRREVAEFTSNLEGPWLSESLGVVDRRAFLDTVGGEQGPGLGLLVDASLTPLVEAWLRANAGLGGEAEGG